MSSHWSKAAIHKRGLYFPWSVASASQVSCVSLAELQNILYWMYLWILGSSYDLWRVEIPWIHVLLMPHSWTLWWWSRKCTNSKIKANSCCPLLCINLQQSCSALDRATGHVLMNTIYHILHLPQKEAGMQLRPVHAEEILGVSESILVYTLFMQLGHHAWLSALTLPVDKI